MSVGRGREEGGQRLSPPSFPPLTRRDRDILYIRSIYSLSVPRTNSNFPDFVPQRDILEDFRLCPSKGQQTFFEFVHCLIRTFFRLCPCPYCPSFMPTSPPSIQNPPCSCRCLRTVFSLVPILSAKSLTVTG